MNKQKAYEVIEEYFPSNTEYNKFIKKLVDALCDEPKPEGKKLADVLQSFSLTLVRASLTNQAWILVKEDADRLAEASKAHLKSKLPEQKLAVMDFTRGGKGTDNFNFGWNSCLEAVKKAIGEA